MPIDSSHLNEAQRDAVERAAALVLGAKQEANKVLVEAGMGDAASGIRCHGHVLGHMACGCTVYRPADHQHGKCETSFTAVDGDVPFDVTCGHPASSHSYDYGDGGE